MRVLRSYGYGVREATIRPKMVLVLWIFNFLFGFFVFYIFYKLLAEAMSQSAVSEGMLTKIDYHFLFEFLTYHGQALGTIRNVALVLIGLYILVSIFLYGGILHSLVETQRTSFLQHFFQGGGKFFGRFLRLTVYSLILWFIFLVVMFILYRVGSALTGKGTNEQLAFYLFLVGVAIALFFIFFINMIQDYTRFKIVTEDSRYVFRSLFQSIGFVFKRLGETLVLYYLLVLTGVVIAVVYWGLRSVIPFSSFGAIVITFLIYQLFIASHGWLKIAFQAGQLSYYTWEKG
ncbi:MAG: hypothetical protein OEY18_16215 [Candidatus Aminicenantes bacterium]|nr:hypothetical protein [Candidatus Aminicenantes bacterium]